MHYLKYFWLHKDNFRRLSADDVKNIGKMAEQGDTLAQLKYGLCYLHGQELPVDFISARRWFEQSSKSEVLAKYFCGFLYEMGFGCKSNFCEALNLYEEVFNLEFPQYSETKDLDTQNKEVGAFLQELYNNANSIVVKIVKAHNFGNYNKDTGWVELQWEITSIDMRYLDNEIRDILPKSIHEFVTLATKFENIYETLEVGSQPWFSNSVNYPIISGLKKIFCALYGRFLVREMLNKLNMHTDKNDAFIYAVARTVCAFNGDTALPNRYVYNFHYLANHDNCGWWQYHTAMLYHLCVDDRNYEMAEKIYTRAIENGNKESLPCYDLLCSNLYNQNIMGKHEPEADWWYNAAHQNSESEYYRNQCLINAAYNGKIEAAKEITCAIEDYDINTVFSNIDARNFFSRKEDEPTNYYELWQDFVTSELEAIKKQDASIRDAQIAEQERINHVNNVFVNAEKTGIVEEVTTRSGWKHSGTVCKYIPNDDSRYKGLENYLNTHGKLRYFAITNSGKGVVAGIDGTWANTNLGPVVHLYPNTKNLVINDNTFSFAELRPVTDLRSGRATDQWMFIAGMGGIPETEKHAEIHKDFSNFLNRNGEYSSLSLDGRNYTHVSPKNYGSNNPQYNAAMQKAAAKYGYVHSAFANNGAIIICCANGIYYENLPINIARALNVIGNIPKDVKFTNGGLYIMVGHDGTCLSDKLTDQMTEEQRTALRKKKEAEEQAKKKEEARKKLEEAQRKKELERKREEKRLAEEEARRLEESSIWNKFKKLF